tara:strand:- start:17637 stop:18002 length:366 start_codon:yes stop_codon:yes gene_type:complete
MNDKYEMEEIFSKKIRAGRRTYFFDVRSTKAGDYYMTITESVKDTNDQGAPSYRKHKIYLYKEDFTNFKEAFDGVSNYIIAEKGEEIISNKKSEKKKYSSSKQEEPSTEFTEVNFDDLGKD